MKDAHIETMPLYSAVSNCNSHHFIWYQITTKTTDIEKEPPISTLKNYLQAKRYLGIVNTQDKNHLHLLYKVKKNNQTSSAFDFQNQKKQINLYPVCIQSRQNLPVKNL